MGFSDTTVSALFLNRRKSDIEFEIESVLTRKLAVTDQCNNIAEILATTVAQNNTYSSITTGNILPGSSTTNYGVSLGASVGISNGQYYENELARLQGIEKELDNTQTKLELELEAVKAEQESMQKLAAEHAKNDFKIGG